MSQIFREKNLKKISSPEQLNDYIHMVKPGIWLVLCAIVVLLAATIAWSVFGYMDSTVTVAAVAYEEEESIILFVKEDVWEYVHPGSVFRINGEEYTLDYIADDYYEVSTEPEIAISEDEIQYALHIGNLTPGEWVRYAYTDGCPLKEGVYKASLVLEHIHPIRFVLN